MKRYDVVLGRSGGRPHARCDETPEGAYVRHYVAQRLIDAKQAEIDALKAQNAELLAAQEGTPCKHKFNAVLGGVLSCIHCYASFSEQKEAIAKARSDELGVQS